MKRALVMLGLVLFVGYAAVSGTCGTSGAVAGGGDDGATSGVDGIAPASQSTGDEYILNGNGCPDSFTYVRAGGSFGGCTFEPGSITLRVYCGGEYNRDFNRGQSGPVWRSDDEPTTRGLSVFWPGGGGADGNGFACVKDRYIDCE